MRQSSIVGHAVSPSSKDVTPANKCPEVHFKNWLTDDGNSASFGDTCTNRPQMDIRLANCLAANSKVKGLQKMSAEMPLFLSNTSGR
jgi:hypothetical protein